jgi:hypothetical protein
MNTASWPRVAPVQPAPAGAGHGHGHGHHGPSGGEDGSGSLVETGICCVYVAAGVPMCSYFPKAAHRLLPRGRRL